MAELAKLSAGAITPLRQWSSAKTTGEKLNLVFQNIADHDGDVEEVRHMGGRDWLIFWSRPVQK